MIQNFRGLLLCAALASSFFACGGTSGTDAGVDAGQACTFGTCGALGYCSPTTNTCAMKSCTQGAAQPDVCSYGQYCGGEGSSAACYDVVAGTCTNFPAGSAPRSWTAASTGPVIISLSKVSLGTDTAFCGADAPVRGKYTVWAYDTLGRLDGEGSQPSLTYYRTNGTPLAVGATAIQNYQVQGQGTSATFDVNFCAPAGTSSLTVGIAYDNGNAACLTL